jgi:Gpi18-like mannosyltransferase
MLKGDRVAQLFRPKRWSMDGAKLKRLSNEIWRFPLIMWFTSRLLIVTVMVGLAPHLSIPSGAVAPKAGWEVFVAWDGLFYQLLATQGYENPTPPSAAFFPLFPLLSRAVMTLGFPFSVAGTLVNSLAFLGALLVLHRWVLEQHGRAAARWTTAVLAWCPLSLFGTVPYSEGLYLLSSIAALRACDRQDYRGMSVWGSLATASRPTGVVLLMAFVWIAWKERRPLIAYIASIGGAAGILLFSLYCSLSLGDPLAFVHAQSAWRPAWGFAWVGWLKLLTQIASGPIDPLTGAVRDWLHPALFTLTWAIAGLLLRFRQRLGNALVGSGFCGLVLLQWLLAGDPWLNVVTVLGGLYLLWFCRHQLRPVVLIYGWLGLGLIISSGSVISMNRIAYGIVSLAIALGLLLSRYPRWGYPVLFWFGVMLASVSLRFAQQQWVA